MKFIIQFSKRNSKYLLLLLIIPFLKAQNTFYQDSVTASNLLPLSIKPYTFPIYNLNNISNTQIHVRYSEHGPEYYRNYYIPRNMIPANPFEIDYRISSFYLPTQVEDEITGIMDRPKNSSFVPVMALAFLAANLAGKYLIIQDKLKITADNIIDSGIAFTVLKELWKHSPQTSIQLFNNKNIRDNFTVKELEKKINILIDNKMVKEKRIENGQTQFFPSKSKEEMIEIIEKILSEKEYKQEQYQHLLTILNIFRQ